MRVFEAIAVACDELTHHSVIEPRVDAEILLACSLGQSRSDLLAHYRDMIDESLFPAFFSKVRERCQGKPLQYIVGHQEFRGLDFEVSPAVFIPRPETELVVEAALEHLADGELNLVDVGTGSGCLAVCLAGALPQARIWATDLSEAALQTARRNAARHRVSCKIDFLRGNLLEPLIPLLDPGQLDAIVSNPPYVSRADFVKLQREVRDWEPRLALVGEERESNIYCRIMSQARLWLKPGGLLIVEIGYNMQEEVCGLLRQDWELLRVSEDLNGIPRVVSAKKV